VHKDIIYQEDNVQFVQDLTLIVVVMDYHKKLLDVKMDIS
jgi:hypothetical protein